MDARGGKGPRLGEDAVIDPNKIRLLFLNDDYGAGPDEGLVRRCVAASQFLLRHIVQNICEPSERR